MHTRTYLLHTDRIWIVIIVALMIHCDLLGQDTLHMARQFRDKGMYDETQQLLDAYLANNPNSIDAIRLRIHTIYLTGEHKKAIQEYREALEQHPGNRGLRRDHAGVLAETGRYREARSILADLLQTDPGDDQARLLLATTYYWQGFMHNALEEVELIDAGSSLYSEASSFRTELQYITALDLRTGIDYAWDDQPLQRPRLSASASKWRSPFLHPQIAADLNRYADDTLTVNTFRLNLGNKLDLRPANITLHPSLELYSNGSTSQFFWSVDAGKVFFNNFKMLLHAGKHTYPYTIGAVDQFVQYHRYSATISWQKANSWLGEIAYRVDDFEDDNRLRNIYAWILSPPLHLASVQLRAGYAFQAADSDENNFASPESLASLLTRYNIGDEVPGRYIPYFTPEGQYSHAITTTLAFRFDQKTSFDLGASIGIFSGASKPFLYIDDTPAVLRDYYDFDHAPVQFDFNLLRKLSPTLSLSLQYNYLKTLYYRSHIIGLQFRKKILPDG